MLFFKESSCPLDMISSPQLFRCRFFRMYLSIHNLLVSGEWWESCGKLPDDLTILCTISKILGVPWTCLVFDKYIKNYFSIIWNKNLFVTFCSILLHKKDIHRLKYILLNLFLKKGNIDEEKCPLDMVLFITL